MYWQQPEERDFGANELGLRTLGISLAGHVAIVAALFVVSWATSLFHHPETIIPIDMTVVPPWAVQDPDDPKPDPNPPPQEVAKPEPKPVVKPEPKPTIPEANEHVDALEKIVEKPKPKKREFKKAKLEEQKKPVAKKPAKKEFKKASLVDAPPRKVDAPKNLPVGKGTSRDKPLSKADFEKALAAGARIGSENHLAASEEQRCFSIIQRVFYENWSGFNWHDGLRPVQLLVRFGGGGRLVSYSIHASSGDKSVDQSVLAAAKRVGAVRGLSAEFLEKHSEIVVEMKPTRE